MISTFQIGKNNKKHFNHHLDIFKFLVDTALEYLGKIITDY